MVKLAVFLAAGMSSRFKQFTNDKPKGFLKINNESLIERSIKILLKYNIEKIIIGTGYCSEHYEKLSEKYPVVTKKNTVYETTNSFYTLHNMQDIIDEDFLLLESDLLYEKRAIIHLQNSSLDDIILASGKTNSTDEVYIETDINMILINMSKNKDDLKRISGELVGISKISMETFQKVCSLFQKEKTLLKKIAYEIALTKLSQKSPIKVDKIDDLVWTEIDNEKHFNRAINIIYPKILEKESG